MLSRAQAEWRCRRGKRELDLLLQTYLENEYDRASVAEKNAFLELLNCQDTELLDHLFNRTIPENPSQVQVVSKLRACLASRA
jgi:antitoxin CptB